VTSRETRRWVIPKGWPWDKLAGHLAAAEEAWEEAGVRGNAHSDVIGTFTYDKRRPDSTIAVEVTVYRLDVKDVFDTWPESKQRERAWFGLDAAAAAIDEPELRNIILALKP
jgi:8-oxo-dGTP pyrophosphatase MutT (NUDIX family)